MYDMEFDNTVDRLRGCWTVSGGLPDRIITDAENSIIDTWKGSKYTSREGERKGRKGGERVLTVWSVSMFAWRRYSFRIRRNATMCRSGSRSAWCKPVRPRVSQDPTRTCLPQPAVSLRCAVNRYRKYRGVVSEWILNMSRIWWILGRLVPSGQLWVFVYEIKPICAEQKRPQALQTLRQLPCNVMT